MIDLHNVCSMLFVDFVLLFNSWNKISWEQNEIFNGILNWWHKTIISLFSLTELRLIYWKKFVLNLKSNSVFDSVFESEKYDLLVLNSAGFIVDGPIFDTLIAASLLTKEWEKNGLKDLSLKQRLKRGQMLTRWNFFYNWSVQKFERLLVNVRDRFF